MEEKGDGWWEQQKDLQASTKVYTDANERMSTGGRNCGRLRLGIAVLVQTYDER